MPLNQPSIFDEALEQSKLLPGGESPDKDIYNIALSQTRPPEEEEHGVTGEFAAGLGRGALRVLATPAYLADVAGEALGVKGLERLGERGAEAVEKYIKESPRLKKSKSIAQDIRENPQLWGDPRWYASLVGEGVPTVLSMLIPGMGAAKAAQLAGWGARGVRAAQIAGGMGAAMGLEAGGAAEQARQYELETGEAIPVGKKLQAVVGTGVVAGALEYTPIFRLFGKTGGRKLIARVLEGMATEGGTETAQEIVANAFTKIGYDADQDMIQGVIESAVGGALIGGGMGGISGPVSNFQEKIQDAAKNPEEVAKVLEEGEKETILDALRETSLEELIATRQDPRSEEYADQIDQVISEKQAEAVTPELTPEERAERGIGRALSEALAAPPGPDRSRVLFEELVPAMMGERPPEAEIRAGLSRAMFKQAFGEEMKQREGLKFLPPGQGFELVGKPKRRPLKTEKPLEKPTPKAEESSKTTREGIETRYSKAGDVVDGRTVRTGIPNQASIEASIDNPTVLKGIHEIPLSEFELTGKHYSVQGNKRIAELAEEIKKSGEITPLIVAIDKEGPYILEGATRADALYRLKAKSFPAKVVIDEGSFLSKPKAEAKPKPEEVKVTETAGEKEVGLTEEDFINRGYTKPTARSRLIIDDIVEAAEGHPGKGGLYPWSIRLTKEGAKKLGLENRFITKATKLHEVAKQWEKKKAEPPSVTLEALGEAKGRIKEALKDQRGSFSMRRKNGPVIYEDLLMVSKHIISQGHTKYTEFSKQLKSMLSEVWVKVKIVASRLFNDAKKMLASEKGAVTIEGIKEGGPLPRTKPDLLDRLDAITKPATPVSKDLSDYQARNIAWTPSKVDWSLDTVKNLTAKMYKKFFMAEYPVVRLAKLAKDPKAVEDIENLIRRVRGKGGIAEEMLTGKGVFRLKDFGTPQETIDYYGLALKEALAGLNSKEEYMDYETLRVAERDVALATYRPDIKGTNKESSQAEIDRIEAKYGSRGMKRLRKISAKHREFERQAILVPLVEMGWMAKKQYEDMISRPEAEYYASFAREMEDVETYTLGGKDPVKKIYGSEKKKIPSVEATIANVYKTVKLVETLRLNKEVVKLADMTEDLAEAIKEVTPQYIVKDVPKRPGPRGGTKVSIRSPIPPKQTIVVPVDGVKHFYRVPPDVHKALDYYSPHEMSVVIKLMNYPVRLLRAGATLSAEFIIRNPIRDQFTAMAYSKFGYIPFWDMGKGMFHLIGKTELYNEYKASGAEQAYFTSMDRTTLNVRARDLLSFKKGMGVKTVNPIEYLRIASEFMEKGTRLGLAARAKKKGATPSQMMATARESTIDFGRIGEERRLNQVIAFWNANVQGADLLRKNLQYHPGRTLLRLTMGITLPSIGLWFFNHSDDDREKRYNALPEWRKNFFWNIPIKDGPVLSLPKPFELGIIFGSLPERILDYAYLKDPKDLKTVGKAVRDGMLPGLIPTAALPIIENIANWNFFMERPIESEAIQRLPAKMRARQYTSEVAKRFGEMANISPLKTDNWIRAWSGSLGRTAVDLIDPLIATKEVPEVSKKWYEVTPGLKGLIAKEPIGSAGKDVNRFYENMQEIIEAEQGHKVLTKNQAREEARKFDKETHNLRRFASSVRSTATTLAGLRKRIVRIIQSKTLTAEQKRVRIEAVKKRMTEVATRFNERVRQGRRAAR